MTTEQLEELFYFEFNPSWAKEGGEEYDSGWVKDCMGKTDFDPILLHLSCRVYPDGDYICCAYLGSDTKLDDTGILKAQSKNDAKKAVEEWCRKTAERYASAVLIAYREASK